MAHRSVQREDRRRRVLREEARPGGTPRKRRSAGGDRLFSEAALERNQPRITDFLPQTKMSVFKVFALGFGLVACVESLYALREQYLLKVRQLDSSWLNLDGARNLTSCVAVVMLIAATVTATLVFHIRRYRMDDYRGRYRIWYPVIGLLAMAAADVMTHAHASIHGLAMSVSPNLPVRTPAAWGILAWLLLGGLFFLRAVVDARKCKAAVLCWLLSASGLSCAAAMKLELLQVSSGHFQAMARTSAYLLGLHFLAFGLLLYARHLFLHAQGVKRLASPKQTVGEDAESQDEAADVEDNRETKRTGMIRLPGFGVWRRRHNKRSSNDAGNDTSNAESVDEGLTREELALLESNDLTRTERRKLKKQMKLRHRQAA